MRKILALLLAFTMIMTVTASVLYRTAEAISSINIARSDSNYSNGEVTPMGKKLGSLSPVNTGTRSLTTKGMLYGFAVSDTSSTNAWVEIDSHNADSYTQLSDSTVYDVAAQYDFNTSLTYACRMADTSSTTLEFGWVDIETNSFTKISDTPGEIISQLAMDYSSNTMYAFAPTYGNGRLFTVNLSTGMFVLKGSISGCTPIALAIDTAGTMYAISSNGTLYSVDKDSCVATSIGNTGLSPNTDYFQSMTFDHDSQTLYMACYSNSNWGSLYSINTNTAASERIGAINNAAITGLHTYPSGNTIPAPAQVDEIIITPETTELMAGTTVKLRANLMPKGENFQGKAIVWNSSAPSVATVSDSGLVSAIAPGSVTITATVDGEGVSQTVDISVLSASEYSEMLSSDVNTAAQGSANYCLIETGTSYPFLPINIDGRTAIASSNRYFPGTKSYIQTTIAIPGGSKIKFDWKLTGTANAKLYINDKEVAVNTRNIWGSYSYDVPRSGVYTIRWEYGINTYDQVIPGILYIDNITIEAGNIAPLENLNVTPGYINLMPGNTFWLVTDYTPVNAVPNVEYTSGNTSVATVSGSGLITAVAAGVTTVTTVSADGSQTKTTTVKVVSQPCNLNEVQAQEVESGTIPFYFGGEGTYISRMNDSVPHYVNMFSVDIQKGDGIEFSISKGTSHSPVMMPSVAVYNQNFEQVATGSSRFIPQTGGTYYIVCHSMLSTSYCGNLVLTIDKFTAVAPTGIEISPDEIEVRPGGYSKLSVTFTPSNTDYREVTWRSENTSVATVDQTGTVHGITEGVTTITVTSVYNTELKATVQVTVTDIANPRYDDAVYAFNLFGAPSLPRGYIKYHLAGEHEGELESVFEMPEGLNIYGSVYVDGYIYGYTYYNYVGYYVVDFLTIDASTFTIQSSQRTGNNVTVYDMAYDYTTDTIYAVTWQMYTNLYSLATVDPRTGNLTYITDFSSATVGVMWTIACDNSGKLYGISSNGTYWSINKVTGATTEVRSLGYDLQYVQTMTYNNHDGLIYWFYYAQNPMLITLNPETGEELSIDLVTTANQLWLTGSFVYITPDILPEPVTPVPATGVTINPSLLTMTVGDITKIFAKLIPDNATNKNVTWASNNPAVVTVSRNGLVTAVHAGSAFITATTEDGGFVASTYVSVSDKLEIPEGYAAVTLKTSDVMSNGTGYQMILDADANAFETGLLPSNPYLQNYFSPIGNVSDAIYDQFEYKIPKTADGVLDTDNVLYEGSITVIIPAGTYDWVITNPMPGNRMWIVTPVGFRADVMNDQVFEEGYNYTFEVILSGTTWDINDTYEYVGITEQIVEKHTVTFINYDGGMLSTYLTPHGTGAVAPIPPAHPNGYEFIGWDMDFSNVQENMTVRAQFDSASAKDVRLGDVNMDDKVNTGDAALILRYVVSTTLFNPSQIELADINEDTKANSGDAAFILRTLVGVGALPDVWISVPEEYQV